MCVYFLNYELIISWFGGWFPQSNSMHVVIEHNDFNRRYLIETLVGGSSASAEHFPPHTHTYTHMHTNKDKQKDTRISGLNPPFWVSISDSLCNDPSRSSLPSSHFHADVTVMNLFVFIFLYVLRLFITIFECSIYIYIYFLILVAC